MPNFHKNLYKKRKGERKGGKERERQTDRQTDRLISKHRAVYFVYLKFYKGMEKRNNYIIRILPFQLQFPFTTTQVN